MTSFNRGDVSWWLIFRGGTRAGGLTRDAAWCEYAFVRTTLDIPDAIFKKTKLKAVHEGVPLKVVVTRALEREVSGGMPDAASNAAIEDAHAPQLHFLAMNRAERSKAFRAESRAMARFYAAHPEEILSDFYDEPESKAR